MFAIKTMPMHSCLALFFHLLHTMFVLILNTTSHAYGVKLKPEKNSGPNGIRTHGLCDARAVLCKLSYQANRELATL